MADLNFDATAVKPSAALEPLPNNWYRAHATESEVKPTSKQNGHFLQFTMKVLDGEYAGRTFWARFNIDNPSAEARKIAEAELSAFCHAAGVLKLKNSQQLHAIPVMVKLVVKPSAEYGPRNEVKGWKACEGAGAPAAQIGPAPQAAASAPAWARKAS